MTSEGAEQTFGGPWSVLKTEMVAKYLTFFTTALSRQPFELVYIDAFAGSGAFRYVPESSQVELLPDTKRVHEGSASLALSTQPPFHRVVFVEQRRKNVLALEKLIARSGHRNASIEQGDANDVLRAYCDPADWTTRRGVIFLDPFGMNVEWPTLEMIAATKALDVWFLFSLGGVNRNIPDSITRLDDTKRRAVTKVLGTEAWIEEFYQLPATPSIDPTALPSTEHKVVGMDDLERYMLHRLKTVFPFVAEPKRLRGHQSVFSLFFAVSNPAPSAIRLAQGPAQHILKAR